MAIRPTANAVGLAVSGGNDILGYDAVRENAPDLIGTSLGEPYVAIGPTRDAIGVTVGSERILVDYARGCNAAYLARASLREPQAGAIRAKGDTVGVTVSCRNVKHGYGAACGNAPDLVRLIVGEPEGIIQPAAANAEWGAAGRTDKFSYDAARGDTPDLPHRKLREPQVAIRPPSNAPRATVSGWNGKLGNVIVAKFPDIKYVFWRLVIPWFHGVFEVVALFSTAVWEVAWFIWMQALPVGPQLINVTVVQPEDRVVRRGRRPHRPTDIVVNAVVHLGG